MLDLPDPRFFFRRPFSVLAVYEDGVFEIFYKIVGQGTTMMADLQPGDEVNVLGPLGIGFTLPEQPEQALLVGGGIGIAPLYFMAKALKGQGLVSPSCFYGVRSHQDVGLSSELSGVFPADRLHIATDDGSFGFSGNVCQAMAEKPELIAAATTAYLCGPTPMMDASYRLLKEMNPNIKIQASLEEHMPCGTGACTGCVTPRCDGKLPSKTCVDGPVFDAEVILWPSQQREQLQGGVTVCKP